MRLNKEDKGKEEETKRESAVLRICFYIIAALMLFLATYLAVFYLKYGISPFIPE